MVRPSFNWNFSCFHISNALAGECVAMLQPECGSRVMKSLFDFKISQWEKVIIKYDTFFPTISSITL
jgi:hypothetical protein